MTEVNEKREQLQIYKEGLSELCRKIEDLQASNHALQVENDALQSQNQDLNAQYRTLLKKCRFLFPLTVLLAFVAIIAAVGFYIRMNLFEDSYHREQASLEQTENDLSETKNALEEAQSTLTEAQSTLAEAQRTLAETQGTLTERENTLTQLYSVLDGYGEGENFGYYSSSFHVYRPYAKGIVILAVGQTKTLEIYHSRLGTMYATVSDAEAVSIAVQGGTSVFPKVNITARQPGTYTVTCKVFSSTFNILVIVPEKGMLPGISDMEEGPLSETLGAGGGTT